MKRRRGRGEGGVYRRADGVWCASVTIGYDQKGKRRRRVIYGTTKGEVLEKLGRLHGAAATGTLIDLQRQTVAQFLDRWIEDSARPAVRRSTYRSYAGLIRNYINPQLGGLPLAKVSPAHVQAAYAAMERAGCSGRLRQLVHAVLHKAFGQAVRWGFLARNPCDSVDKPRAPRRTMQVLAPEQVFTLIAAAETDRLGALYVLAVATGLRQGELLGLHWADVALNTATIAVRRQLSEDGGVLELVEPKTNKGRRRVELPEFAVKALHAHRDRMLVEGLGAVPWVFCDTQGNPLRKSNLLRRSFKPFLQRAELPAVRFHDLRHTAATLMLAQGVHPKIVQECLGHAQISLTLDTYSHVLPSMQKDAASKLDKLLDELRRKAEADSAAPKNPERS